VFAKLVRLVFFIDFISTAQMHVEDSNWQQSFTFKNNKQFKLDSKDVQYHISPLNRSVSIPNVMHWIQNAKKHIFTMKVVLTEDVVLPLRTEQNISFFIRILLAKPIKIAPFRHWLIMIVQCFSSKLCRLHRRTGLIGSLLVLLSHLL